MSDRPFVWVGFRSPDRVVRRWIGERNADEERASPHSFSGDPTDPATYLWTRDSLDLSAVVDLQDQKRAAGAIDALRRSRPEAAVLVITANDDLDAPDVAISRRLAWTDALRVDLEGELRKLEALRRLNALRDFASGDGVVAIAVHPDPDPDALASALALRALLRRDPDRTPIVTLGAMTRPENRRMAELLDMRVAVITRDELQRLERVLAVDFQPQLEDQDPRPLVAIIDHHPFTEAPDAEFMDIRPAFGATATIMTEYLRLDDERRIAEPLATALLYGIKTDTDSLGRGCMPADVEAYAFLQTRADQELLRRLERPSYSVDTARKYGGALAHLAMEDDVALVFLGSIPATEAHILADIADFCLTLEESTWAIAAGIIDEQLVLTIRHLGGAPGAGDLAEAISATNGTGGGHPTMARAAINVDSEWQAVLEGPQEEVPGKLNAVVRDHLAQLRVNLRSSRPTRPAKAPSAAT